MKKLLIATLLCISTSSFAEEDPIGKVLVRYNCSACHSVERKVVGPAFNDVASKYKGVAKAEDTLVKKVSQGGSGVWGSTPMPANDATGEHQADIRRAVRYVLALTK